MATEARGAWADDEALEADLRKYVAENLKRCEILDFVREKYPFYAWSIPTLDRRLRSFNIRYIDKNVSLDQVIHAVKEELDGPGKLLGYRSMNQKLRTIHNIQVPRELVSDVLWDLDPDGVSERSLKRKKIVRKKPFVSEGPYYTFSLDGHDKMMGYQNSTFPAAVYGCLDTFSRKIMYLKVWDGNSDPYLIGKFYMEYLLESKTLPTYLRLDKGSETGVMATMHTFLNSQLESRIGKFRVPTDCVIFGPSTSNKIERWWKDLHERMEKDLKSHLVELLQRKLYDPQNDLHRQILAYIFIPILQRVCDVFAKFWNSHRIRYQKGLELPCGVVNHMFSFPEKYGAENQGVEVEEDLLVETAINAELEKAPSDYLSAETRANFSTLCEEPSKLCCKDIIPCYNFMKNQLEM